MCIHTHIQVGHDLVTEQQQHPHSETHTYIHTQTLHTHTQTHTHTYIHTERENMFTHRDTYITHTRADTYMYTHRDTHRQTHTWSSCGLAAQTVPTGPWLLQPVGKPGTLGFPLPSQCPTQEPRCATPAPPRPPPAAGGPTTGSALASPGSVLSVCSCCSVLFLAFETGMSWCHCGFDLHFPGD